MIAEWIGLRWPDRLNPFQGRPNTANLSLWDRIPMGYRFFLPQRGFVPKPRVGVRHESLPWETLTQDPLPHRGCVRIQRPPTGTQPRWGRNPFGSLPRVGRRAAVQPWALGRIPVGEEDGTTLNPMVP